MPTTDRPLAAKRIVVTRSAAQSSDLLDALRRAGALPVAAPAIRVIEPDDMTPLRDALRTLHTFSWLVCTSANGARAVLAGTDVARWPSTCRIAVVGAATARVFTDAGLTVHFTPSRAIADALGDELPDAAAQRVLWPHGDLATLTLRDRLVARGATVVDPIAYRTVSDVGLLGVVDALRDGRVDALTFTSASTVRHVVEGLGAAGIQLDRFSADARPKVVCLGPVTAAAARECGLVVDAVAEQQDDAGLIDALARVFSHPSALR